MTILKQRNPGFGQSKRFIRTGNERTRWRVSTLAVGDDRYDGAAGDQVDRQEAHQVDLVVSNLYKTKTK